jgi:AraC family transcriptional regulator
MLNSHAASDFATPSFKRMARFGQLRTAQTAQAIARPQESRAATMTARHLGPDTMVYTQLASSHQGLCRVERIGPLVLSEVFHPPGSRIGWHCHEMAAFALTLNGSSIETFTNASFERAERGLLVRPAGERHRDSVGSQGETCFLIEVDGTWLGDVPEFRSIVQDLTIHRPGTITQLAQRVHCEWHYNDSASPIAIQALIYELAARLVREGKARDGAAQPPAWLQRVKQRLDEDFAETPSLTELAGIAGVHPTHLARHFRRHCRSTIGDYLRQRRVAVAMELLSGKKLSLTEIALESGFSSHGHFCTVFKRVTGMTPSEFRDIKTSRFA